MKRRSPRLWILFVLLCLLPMLYSGRSEASANVDETIDAAEADALPKNDERSTWNDFDNRFFTMRLGGGFLVDTAAYAQDANSKSQMSLTSKIALRDLRLLLKGRFHFSPRLSYSIGYMYDGANDVWRFRQTGLMIDVPELNGNFFIGRTKEGFSTSKIMVGYNGWTNERSAANDAFLPILADGVKWMGRGFGGKFVYNLGWFTNALTPNQQTYVKNDEQVAARAVWLPNAGMNEKPVLHLALEARHGSALKGNQQYRSKPESFPAQSYAVDTGKFPASSSEMMGLEAYFRPGPLVLGSEYFFNDVSSVQKNDPQFHGGEAFAAYMLTGETRGYNERGGFFEAVSPARPLGQHGAGAWELVLRYSYVDLTSGAIDGGKFWRITPMVNWYLADGARLEFVYGYSELEKSGAIGATQFIQTRLQLQLL